DLRTTPDRMTLRARSARQRFDAPRRDGRANRAGRHRDGGDLSWAIADPRGVPLGWVRGDRDLDAVQSRARHDAHAPAPRAIADLTRVKGGPDGGNLRSWPRPPPGRRDFRA